MDQTLLNSDPTTHLPGMPRTRTDGPRPHLSAPSRLSVAVGNRKTGPAPQITFPGSLGDRNPVKVVSPSPVSRSWPGERPGWDTIGTIVRVIRFQSSVSSNGQTGWMLRMFWALSWRRS